MILRKSLISSESSESEITGKPSIISPTSEVGGWGREKSVLNSPELFDRTPLCTRNKHVGLDNIMLPSSNQYSASFTAWSVVEVEASGWVQELFRMEEPVSCPARSCPFNA